MILPIVPAPVGTRGSPGVSGKRVGMRAYDHPATMRNEAMIRGSLRIRGKSRLDD